jgi:uncharacterized protein
LKTSNEVLYAKSRFVQAVERGGSAIIWHSLFGNPQVVSVSVITLLDAMTEARTIDSLAEEYNLPPDAQQTIERLLASHFLVQHDFDERGFLALQMRNRETAITSGSMIDYLELIMSEACNFRCTYCIHFNNLETSDRINNPNKFMSFERGRETVDRYLAILRNSNKRTASINFGGGEPLLAWSVVHQVLEYCHANHGSEFAFNFSINTNGSLITREIARTLRNFKVSIAISLDGIGEFNDRVRIKRPGTGTFHEIVRGIEALAEENYPIDGVATTINEHNFEGLSEELIDWARNHGMREVRIDVDVINMVALSVDAIVERLVRVRRYAKSVGVVVPGFWSRAFENMNESPLTAPVAFCGAVRGNSMCVSPSGNIYGCGYSTTKLGSLIQIETFHKSGGDYHRFVRDHLTGTMEMCKGCMIEGQCGGGCNITQEFSCATNSVKIQRMCEFYCAMTKELVTEQLDELTLPA